MASDVTPLRARLGQRLRNFREQKAWSQETLGAEAGLSYKFIGEIERGLANPSVETLDALCNALEIDVADLFGPADFTVFDEPSLTRRESQLAREALESLEGLVRRLSPPAQRGDDVKYRRRRRANTHQETRRRSSEQADAAFGDLRPRHDLDLAGGLTALLAAGHDPSPLQPEVLHTLAQPGERILIHGAPQLDFDRQHPPPVDQQQIDFRASLRAPVERLRANELVVGGGNQLLDDQTLERRSSPDPRRQLRRLPQTGEMVQQAGVAHEQLGAW